MCDPSWSLQGKTMTHYSIIRTTNKHPSSLTEHVKMLRLLYQFFMGVKIACYYQKSSVRFPCLLLHKQINAFGSREQPISSQSNAGVHRVTILATNTLPVLQCRSGIQPVRLLQTRSPQNAETLKPGVQSWRISQNMTCWSRHKLVCITTFIYFL